MNAVYGQLFNSAFNKEIKTVRSIHADSMNHFCYWVHDVKQQQQDGKKTLNYEWSVCLSLPLVQPKNEFFCVICKKKISMNNILRLI